MSLIKEIVKNLTEETITIILSGNSQTTCLTQKLKNTLKVFPWMVRQSLKFRFI
jgi:hypothetical protein